MAPQYVVYSLEDSVTTFFQDYTDTTRPECDDLAQRLVGPPVRPVPIQGQFSYTVLAGNFQNHKIVQFRAGIADLDMAIMSLAREVHPEFAPKCSHHGKIGSTLPLSIYVMDEMPGIAHVKARDTNRRNTITDLARFFSRAWIYRQTPNERHETQQKFAQDLDILRDFLPNRFSRVLDQSRTMLSVLFAPSYPFALAHDDLSSTNMLVGPSGHITGVIDWQGAKVLPFGMSLYALENILGMMGSHGWCYNNDQCELESLFWQEFECLVGGLTADERSVIPLARSIGILFQYGFTWEGGAHRRPTKEGDSKMRYLDAFMHLLERII